MIFIMVSQDTKKPTCAACKFTTLLITIIVLGCLISANYGKVNVDFTIIKEDGELTPVIWIPQTNSTDTKIISTSNKACFIAECADYYEPMNREGLTYCHNASSNESCAIRVAVNDREANQTLNLELFRASNGLSIILFVSCDPNTTIPTANGTKIVQGYSWNASWTQKTDSWQKVVNGSQSDDRLWRWNALFSCSVAVFTTTATESTPTATKSSTSLYSMDDRETSMNQEIDSMTASTMPDTSLPALGIKTTQLNGSVESVEPYITITLPSGSKRGTQKILVIAVPTVGGILIVIIIIAVRVVVRRKRDKTQKSFTGPVYFSRESIDLFGADNCQSSNMEMSCERQSQIQLSTPTHAPKEKTKETSRFAINTGDLYAVVKKGNSENKLVVPSANQSKSHNFPNDPNTSDISTPMEAELTYKTVELIENDLYATSSN